jgi:hypothetical protein
MSEIGEVEHDNTQELNIDNCGENAKFNNFITISPDNKNSNSLLSEKKWSFFIFFFPC